MLYHYHNNFFRTVRIIPFILLFLLSGLISSCKKNDIVDNSFEGYVESSIPEYHKNLFYISIVFHNNSECDVVSYRAEDNIESPGIILIPESKYREQMTFQQEEDRINIIDNLGTIAISGIINDSGSSLEITVKRDLSPAWTEFHDLFSWKECATLHSSSAFFD